MPSPERFIMIPGSVSHVYSSMTNELIMKSEGRVNITFSRTRGATSSQCVSPLRGMHGRNSKHEGFRIETQKDY